MSMDNAYFLMLVGMLVVAVSALFAQRPSIGSVIRSLVAWGAIAGIAYVGIRHADQVESSVTAIAEQLGMGQQRVDGETVRITMSPDGHFWARVRLNDFEKRMLVDSGATITALSQETARKAGITSQGGMSVVIETANGSVPAVRGRAERVSIGGLETKELGVVISPAFGETDVLGMNFLSRLGSWRVEGRTLVLEPKRERERGGSDEPA